MLVALCFDLLPINSIRSYKLPRRLCSIVPLKAVTGRPKRLIYWAYYGFFNQQQIHVVMRQNVQPLPSSFLPLKFTLVLNFNVSQSDTENKCF